MNFDSDLISTVNIETESASSHPSSAWVQAVTSLLLFVLAGLCEIGGGYLVWRGIKQDEHKTVLIVCGSFLLILYGFIPTLQESESFGRVYAVYGGFFIVMSYTWVAVIEGFVPDVGDYAGAGIALCGVCIAWFWPR